MSTRNAIFFDLDGTLLPMDLEEFIQTYFGLLARQLPQYDTKRMLSALWQGTKAMMVNDGSMTNESRFWDVFSAHLGPAIREEEPVLETFYRTAFHQAKDVCGENPQARSIIDLAHQKADLVVLATNPLFPRCAVESRLSWIGLKPEDFDYITSYENSSFCKPTADYYQGICRELNLQPSHCLMVGNDLKEDAWGASSAGLDVHIVTDCLITHGLDLNAYPHSTVSELGQYL